jgi:hypothetical protein
MIFYYFIKNDFFIIFIKYKTMSDNIKYLWKYPSYTSLVRSQINVDDYVLKCNECNSLSGSYWIIEHNINCSHCNLSINSKRGWVRNRSTGKITKLDYN